jgi:hypothetical protein
VSELAGLYDFFVEWDGARGMQRSLGDRP